MPAAVLERFVGDKGESDAYRALIAQLAIVTGAPDAAHGYFASPEELDEEDLLDEVISLGGGPAATDGADHEAVQRVLSAARDWYGGQVKVRHMLMTAPIARQYSFTAWPQVLDPSNDMRAVHPAAAELERACSDGTDDADVETLVRKVTQLLGPVISELQALGPRQLP